MIRAHPLTERTPRQADEFIRVFFGTGNTVWPDQDPDSPAGRRLVPYLHVLRAGSDVPIVLPRRREDDDQLLAYVIALDPAHATAVAELLIAFAGPSYTTFDGLPARLDPDDPVDRAVIDYAGPDLTFVLTSPTRASQAQTWIALDQMQAIMASRPVRSWHAPKPIGRLLAEFEIALAAGDNSASAALLDHLAASGGLSATNLAHLRIKRLTRLGRDSELLRMPGLADVVLADPPLPVKDAVLAAIYARVAAGEALTGDLQAAQENLIEAGTLVPALLTTSLPGLSVEALTVLALAAWVRADISVLRRILASSPQFAQLQQLAPGVAEAVAAMAADTPAVQPDSEPTAQAAGAEPAAAEPHDPVPASWLELIAAIAAGSSAPAGIMADQSWREWDPPALNDQAIAHVLGGLDDDAAERAWSIAGAFVDAVGYQQSAPRSARELINNALAHGRFSPGDLAGLNALTEVVLRAGPAPREYAELLDDLRAECGRWAGPDRANVVLDMADLLARSACPEQEARLRLAISLLRPLHDHRTRLEPDQAHFARQLGSELGVGLDWADAKQATDGRGPLDDLPSLRVLLYSLDEGVLNRTSAILETLAPAAEVRLSHDHAGTPRLRQYARGADVIVLATRCATHAATGFIRANAAATAVVTEADGSGSASLLRAAIMGLQTAANARAA